MKRFCVIPVFIFHNFKEGTVVNIEFDVFGKYVQRLLEQYLEAQK